MIYQAKPIIKGNAIIGLAVLTENGWIGQWTDGLTHSLHTVDPTSEGEMAAVEWVRKEWEERLARVESGETVG